MKNKINLLLVLGFSLVLMNCSGKKTHTASSVPTPTVPPKPSVTNRPSLGTPIQSTPVQQPRPLLEQNIPVQQRPPEMQIRPRETTPPKPRPRVEPKMGESYFSKKFKLSSKVKETSGLIKVDNRLWTFNDSGGKPALYQINERNGAIVKTVHIKNASNYDWEDITYDDNYVYIGDFGNNRGNRKELKVYKIPRASLRSQKSVRAEVIHFNFSDQRDFSSKPQKNNYDCEAMIAYHGKLYLFSKNWQDQKTRLYELSTRAGRHQAKYMRTFNIRGMVTGASINRELDILLLTTYSPLLTVNIWAFTNFQGTNFFGGNAKRLNLSKVLQGQIEGVTFTGNYKAYLSSEAFRKYIFSFDATLYSLDFSGEFE